ncbi:unnamed protein product [Hermetia illucens]|uniref:Uncharacterized protein n=1 Tax=Hermetia illucens TaxID=343691 RepID=A0A7R8YX57_HERIL|nr:uncharacterized protein LOC119654691 [Hermetia illucens]CAD7087542.1 unnamed protein product [Hermetia illucens]
MNLWKIASFAIAVDLAVLVLSADVQAKDDGKKIGEYIANITKACLSEGEPFGDMQEIIEEGNPTQNEKCVIACIMTNWGMLSENGEFQPDGVREVHKAIQASDRYLEKYKNIDEVIIAKCGSIDEPEKCDKGYALAECCFKIFAEARR